MAQAKGSSDSAAASSMSPPRLGAAEEGSSTTGRDRSDVEGAISAPDADNPNFIGVGSEVARILDAVDEALVDASTKEQVAAARLMGKLLDAATVDRALDLPPGTVKGLMANEAFFEKVVDARQFFLTYRDPDQDLSRVLSPKQREAARMRALEGLSQVETADLLKVSDRTIRNWEKNPAFGIYQDQLVSAEQKQRIAKRREEADRFVAAREKALATLVRAVEAGERKAAVEILRLPR